MYKKWGKQETAVIDWAWGNIYWQGGNCMAHSHLSADASIVFMLESGNADLDRVVYSGRFYFVDSRLPYCTSHEQGRLGRVLIADMPPGSMIIFLGSLVHSVNPYNGTVPRVTLPWSINTSQLPGSPGFN